MSRRGDPEKRKEWVKNYRSSSFKYVIARTVAQARKRCEEKGIPFGTTTTDVNKLFDAQRGRCAVSGMPFERTGTPGHPCPRSLSIDRIDPEKGYVNGNLRLVLYAVNAFKNTGTDEEMYEICQAIMNNRDTVLAGFSAKSPEGATRGSLSCTR